MLKMTLKNCNHGKITATILSSPIGELEMKCCLKGVISLGTVSKKILHDEFHPDERIIVGVKGGTKPVGDITEQAITWLQTYFTNPKLTKSMSIPPLCHLATERETSSFTENVWKTLATEVPLGTTISYGNLAVKSGGKPTASRAVGQVMRNNPVGIIVPCHRVVLSSGSIGNYSGGQKNCVKEWLLHHEKF